MSEPRNHIASTVWMSTTLPSAETSTAYEALTWVQIKGVQTLPVFGRSHGNTDVDDLQAGETIGVKGMGSGNDSSMTFFTVDADPGQVALEAACEDSQGLLALKVCERGTGTDNLPATGDKVRYAKGYAHSFLPNPGSGTSSDGFSANFKQNGIKVEATEPA